MATSFFDALSSQLRRFLSPLLDAVDDPFWLAALLRELGSNPSDPAAAPITNALQTVSSVVQEIETISAEPSPSFADIAHLLESVKQAIAAIQVLDSQSQSQLTAGLEGIGKDLIDLLTGMYIAAASPLLYRILILLTVVDAAEDIVPTQPVMVEGKVARGAVSLPRFHPDRLIKLIQDPVSLLKSQYLNPLATDADASAMADKLFPRVRGLLRVLGVLCKYGVTPQELPQLGDGAPFVDHALTVWVVEEVLGASADAGLTLVISPASRGDLGLVMTPFGAIQYQLQTGNWTIEFDFTASIDALAIGRRGPVIAASAQNATVDAKFTATLASPDSGPAFLLGSATGTRLEIGGAVFETELNVSGGTYLWSISADVSSSAIVLSPGDGDSFLSSVLPAGGFNIKFDLGATWSNKTAFAFRGAGSLEASLPINISIGGVIKVPVLYIGIEADDVNGIGMEASLGVSVIIGPLTALIDHVGLAAAVTFPPTGGNLGNADFSFDFKPPAGVGLAIDAAGVNGGGFLSFQPAQHQYSGVLQLQFNELALQAFGLITTQVAGGAGYSLLALIDADFPPIQLGWGFTLNGVGGLLAMHRTADTDALRAALQAGKLSTILFPTNAIANAAQILAQLNTLFPTAQGRFLFGPMALIGWGTPTVISAAVAVILELPEPVRIVLIARINAGLPSASKPLVRINMDALGVLDLSQGQLSLDASLYDSKIIQFALTGDMSLRANWSVQREFLLAIGGFHPQFTPPAGFPALQRITINMPSGQVTKLRLAAYLAITSNTVQFGAALDVFIGVSGYGLAGHLSFDALLQIDPFAFSADISGSVALMAGGDDLMSVGLDATLTGPAPWNIAGKFKVHLFFFDVSKSFSYTWGDSTSSPQIPAVNVLTLLTAALSDSRNWQANLPANGLPLISVRSRDGSTVIAHPLAALEMHETVVPLGLQITRYGSAPISGPSTFTITGFNINGSTIQSQAVQEDFAPAQFFDLTDEQKLSGPSFERQDAGAVLACGSPVSGPAAPAKSVAYQTFYIDQPGGQLRTDPAPPQLRVFDQNFLLALKLGASARAEIRQAGKARYATPGNPMKVAPLAFTVAGTATLTAAGIAPPSGVNYSQARALLAAAVSSAPANRTAMQIVATYEIAAPTHA